MTERFRCFRVGHRNLEQKVIPSLNPTTTTSAKAGLVCGCMFVAFAANRHQFGSPGEDLFLDAAGKRFNLHSCATAETVRGPLAYLG